VSYPTFMYGPKDGSPVPDTLWILDDIEMCQKFPDGSSMIYFYRREPSTNNYIYRGQLKEEGHGHG
jgi:hypothetical protein